MTEQIFPLLPEQQCQVLQETYTHTQTVYDILLDEPIEEPKYYRDAFHVLRTASEMDMVRIIINSPGGLLSSAIAFRNAIAEANCPVIAVIEGECHSAASMIACSCDDMEVKDYASSLVHSASYGSMGTSSNIQAHVDFTTKQTQKFIREVYATYLSEQEIDEVLKNREIWMDADEMRERWVNVQEMRKLEWEAEHGEPDEEEIIDKPVVTH